MKPIISLILSSFLAISAIAGMAKAGPASPTISASDLDACIDALPRASRMDPVNRLRSRLQELYMQKSSTEESRGLNQALGLIGLARSIRITSGDSDAGTLLAGL